MAAAVDPSGNLWVGDPGNRRGLEFNAPFSSGVSVNEAASIVLGEPDFTTVAGGLNCPTTSTSLCPQGLAFDSSGNLYAADHDNNRVLEYNTPLSYIGTTPQPANQVFGQGSASRVLGTFTDFSDDASTAALRDEFTLSEVEATRFVFAVLSRNRSRSRRWRYPSVEPRSGERAADTLGELGWCAGPIDHLHRFREFKNPRVSLQHVADFIEICGKSSG
jgi:hypothetical protein